MKILPYLCKVKLLITLLKLTTMEIKFYNQYKGITETALFVEKKGKFSKLKKFVGYPTGKEIIRGFYWFTDMKQGGNWNRGGFYPNEICSRPNDFICLTTMKVYKFIKIIE